MKGVLDYFKLLDRGDLSAGEHGYRGFLYGIVVIDLQDKKVLESHIKFLENLLLPKIDCVELFLLRLMFSSTSMSIIVGIFPFPNFLGINRTSKSHDYEVP